jgi:hypothetical protein
MVVDSDGMGLGGFVPISEEDRQTLQEAKARGLVVTPAERALVFKVADDLPRWTGERDRDHDMRVFHELDTDPLRDHKFSPLKVMAIMAAWRARRTA